VPVSNASTEGTTDFVYNNVILTVKSDTDIKTVEAHLKTLARASIGEPGCRRFDVFHSETEPLVFMLIEEWQSQRALTLHREADAFKTVYIPLVIPLVERTPHLCKILTTPWTS